MKYILTLFLFLSVNLYGQIQKDTLFNIISFTPEKAIYADDSTLDFWNTTPHTIMGSLINFQSINMDHYTVVMNTSLDTILAFRKNENKIYRIPLSFRFPVQTYYFHNLDSIFLFPSIDIVEEAGIDPFKRLDDMILINRKGDIIEKYNLDEIPYFKYGNEEALTLIKNMLVQNRWCIGNRIYIPLMLYRPGIEEKSLKKLNISILAEYDLNTKSVRMMDVRIPEEDIGAEFVQKVNASNVDFQILDENTIIYSFHYKGDVFKLDISTNQSTLLYNDDSFYFSNFNLDATQSYTSDFYTPVFIKNQNTYLRRIYLYRYRNYKNISIQQVFDSNMKSLGYNFPDSIYSSVYSYQNNYALSDKTDAYKRYYATMGMEGKKSIHEIAKVYFEEEKRKQAASIDLNLPMDLRFQMLIDDLKIDSSTTIITIPNQLSCASMVEHLMKLSKEFPKSFKTYNVKFLFYGEEDDDLIKSLINSFKISEDQYIIDPEKHQQYLKPKEYNTYKIIKIMQDSELEIIDFDIKNVI